jgi:holo-[acyl-carrier protein] synthase
MILGIGIDLVNIARIERIIEKWGDKFKKKAFSESEIKYAEGYNKSYEHFAANFAVKEAFFKAIGRGFRGDMRIHDVEVLRDDNGKPYINLHGRARQSTDLLGVSSIHTSISHDVEYSVAVVILEKQI